MAIMQFDFHVQKKTPYSNTGLNYQISQTNTNQSYQARFEEKIDTISGIFREVESENDAVAIINRFEDLFNDRVTFLPRASITNGKKWDGHSTGSLRGLKFYWSRPQIGKPGNLCIYISGGAIEQVEQDDIRALFLVLCPIYQFDATRLDIALDDYAKIVSFEQIKAAIRAGDYSRVRCFTLMESIGTENGGETIYCGSPQSEKRLRVYDKAAESMGEKDCYRWELQLRGYKADVSFFRWLSETCADGFLSRLVIGSVDFVDRSSGDHHVDRLPRLPWWEEFCYFIGEGVKIPSKKIVASLQKTVKWINDSVAPSLARIQITHPDEFAVWIQCAMDDAFNRFNRSDIAKLQIYQNEELLF